jgi:NADP-dependent 3-hydroxy acid dehydrogenase YdfG
MVEETANSITKAEYRAKAIKLDVTDFEAVKKLVDNTVAEYGRIDYMFNNAGIAIGGEARDFEYEDWRKVIDTNLYGVVNGVAAVYPIMVKQGFGHIINTSSLAGLIPAPGEIPYTASKYGVLGLSNALRMEAAGLGVKVSVVCPGFIDTPIYYTNEVVNLNREKTLEYLPKNLTSARECARVILRGVVRNKATIVVTLHAKFFYLLQRISPGLMLLIGKQYIKIWRNARIKD